MITFRPESPYLISFLSVENHNIWRQKNLATVNAADHPAVEEVPVVEEVLVAAEGSEDEVADRGLEGQEQGAVETGRHLILYL